MKNPFKARKERALQRELETIENWNRYGISITDQGSESASLFDFSIDVESCKVDQSNMSDYVQAMEDAKDVINDFAYYKPYILWMV